MKNKVILFLDVLLILVAGCLPIEKLTSQTVAAPTNVSYSVLENGLGLVQLWKVSGIVMWKAYQKAPLAFWGDYLVLVDSSENETSPNLLGFDVHTGKLVWQTHLPDGCFSLINVQGTIFINTKNALQAYDMSTGFLNWENTELPSMKIYAMQNNNDTSIYAYYKDVLGNNKNQVVYTIDITTGEIIDVKKIANPVSMWEFQIEKVSYGTNANEILSIDTDSSQVYWKATLEDTFATYLTEVNQEILLAVSRRNHAMYALNTNDGKVKWQYTQHLISNPAVEDESIFVLIAGDELIRFNLHTGERTGKVVFRAQNNSNDENSNNLIVVSGNMLALYFADSSQLVVYEVTK